LTARSAIVAEPAGGAAPAAPRQAALIVNVRAGNAAGMAAPRETIAAALRASGFAIPAGPADDDLDAQWQAADSSGARIVFVAGGDGTLRTAAMRLMGTERVLAPLPGGTMNRVCARLGLPADPIAAAHAYRGGVEGKLTVGEVAGEVFLYEAVVGAPTRLMRFREMQRGAGARGWWPLLRALLRGLLRPADSSLRARVPGERRRRAHAVVVRVPPPDGPALFAIELARPRNALDRLRQGWRWIRGRLRDDPAVASADAAHGVVHAGQAMLRVSLDGETLLAPPPLRFRLRPAALDVLVPAR
jgi:diacylglycerol kinase family enzyme